MTQHSVRPAFHAWLLPLAALIGLAASLFVVGGNAILKPQVSDQVVAYALPASSG